MIINSTRIFTYKCLFISCVYETIRFALRGGGVRFFLLIRLLLPAAFLPRSSAARRYPPFKNPCAHG